MQKIKEKKRERVNSIFGPHLLNKHHCSHKQEESWSRTVRELTPNANSAPCPAKSPKLKAQRASFNKPCYTFRVRSLKTLLLSSSYLKKFIFD